MSARATIAIAGCGAVTARYYLPAMKALHHRARVVGLYDSDTARSRAMSDDFPGAHAVETFEALLALGADVVIVASPPIAHAEQAVASLKAGCHVLCEKPMTLSREDATAMADAAKRHERLLAVNMVRRHFPASRIVGQLVRAGTLGGLRSASVFEGGAFRWPIRDQSYFTRHESGGGVLADVGTHMIDLLGAWFGTPTFFRYEDDAMGGVEVNALLTLRFGAAPATLRLSRDWARPNRAELVFEKARVRWSAEQMSSVELQFDCAAPLMLQDESARAFRFVNCFTAQIEAVLDHMEGRPACVVTAEQALFTVALVEQAYANKRPMAMPWLAPVAGGAHG